MASESSFEEDNISLRGQHLSTLKEESAIEIGEINMENNLAAEIARASFGATTADSDEANEWTADHTQKSLPESNMSKIFVES